MRSKELLLIYQSPNIGGTRTYFFQLTNYLINLSYAITLLVKEDELDNSITDHCSHNNIKIISYGQQIKDVHLYSFSNIKNIILYIYNYLKQVIFLWKIYYKVWPKTIIISQGWPFIWFRALFLPGKKYFIQHVMPLHPLDKGGYFFLKIALFFRQGFFISVSDFAQNKMRKHWLGNYSKIKTIYNYYEKTVIISSVEKSTSKVIILCLARVEEGKSPLTWIKVAEKIVKRYPSVKFLWAGKGSLLEIAQKETASNPNINFLGHTDNVDNLYARADIYFEASKREAHGISVVGAMAWGIPAIATINGGTTESVIHKKTGFIVNVDDVEEIYRSLVALINSPNQRKSMGKAAYLRYNEIFTKKLWEKEMSQLL